MNVDYVVQKLGSPCLPYRPSQLPGSSTPYVLHDYSVSQVDMSYKHCKSNNVLHLSHHSHRIERIERIDYLTQNPLQ
jgi:hypothetical protein